MAAEILCKRGTIVVLREMFAGSTRFNELRRGVPRMSPALLSRRLKELESAGVVDRTASAFDPAVFEYHLTEAGRELGPLVQAFGIWGQRRIESNLSFANLDADLLMRDMRRSLNITPMCRRGAAWLSLSIPSSRRRSGGIGWWSTPDPAPPCARSTLASRSTSMLPSICGP
jgi:DNA-binding HxlR family transcriptional regulator